MSTQRYIRKIALQALYQFDAGRIDEPDDVRRALEASPGGEDSQKLGFNLATAAWEHREAADQAVAPLSPDWPTHRQPVVDRNILRLAHYEMHHTDTPPKVAINEAVELAKEFSTERSHLFINGILDKLFRVMRESDTDSTSEDHDHQSKTNLTGNESPIKKEP